VAVQGNCFIGSVCALRLLHANNVPPSDIPRHAASAVVAVAGWGAKAPHKWQVAQADCNVTRAGLFVLAGGIALAGVNRF
jgi:hypothetical protein